MRILGLGVFVCFALLIGNGTAQEFRATLNGMVSDAQDARSSGCTGYAPGTATSR